jgi:protein MpaA
MQPTVRARLGAALVLALAPAAPAAAARAAAPTPEPEPPAVLETRVIGTSVDGREIRAWRLGEKAAARRVVLLGVMHGDEKPPARILTTLRDRPAFAGVDLWVVPVVNPDGAEAGSRQNARGVDLNRNFPHIWKADTRVRYHSGAEPASEPETRATMRFLDDVDPELVLSFHQPFDALDTTLVKQTWLARDVADALGLAMRPIPCAQGPCHGTLTGWFNAAHDGMALTVELGPEPSEAYLTGTAPEQLLDVLDGPRHWWAAR